MAQPLNASFDGRPEDYDRLRQCWLNERRFRFLSGRLAKLGLVAGDQVLEIGSGTGWLLRRLGEAFPAVRFTGADPEPAYIDFARRIGGKNISYFRCSAEECHQQLDPGFRVVLSNDVLHHVASAPSVVKSITSVASPGAHWIAIEPNRLNPYTYWKQRCTFGERNFSPRELLEPSQTLGWRLARKRYLFLVPPFVRSIPHWIGGVEAAVDNIPFLAGGVSIELILQGGDS